MFRMSFASAFRSATASAGALESIASTCSQVRARWSETSGRGEAIERFARCIARGREVIFALVQVDSGLLPAEKIGFQLEPVHLYGHGCIELAGEECDFARKLFERADRRIVAGHDGARRKLRFESRGDLWCSAIHTLIEHLDDEAIAIAIDNQTGEEITFRVGQTISGGIGDDLFAEPLGLGDAGGDVERLG